MTRDGGHRQSTAGDQHGYRTEGRGAEDQVGYGLELTKGQTQLLGCGRNLEHRDQDEFVPLLFSMPSTPASTAYWRQNLCSGLNCPSGPHRLPDPEIRHGSNFNQHLELVHKRTRSPWPTLPLGSLPHTLLWHGWLLRVPTLPIPFLCPPSSAKPTDSDI